jgi:G:T-mismatch repair DNA endonuclease (very short patch repair protein)
LRRFSFFRTPVASSVQALNRREWWLAKLNGNAARDKVHQAALKKLSWRVMVLWECETESAKRLGQFTRRLCA